MGIRTRKPRTASLRFQTFLDTRDLTRKKPEKSLIIGLKKSGGRNAYGRITTRHIGGGAVRRYRIIDFRRSQRDVLAVVKAVEYDPNRNVRIALIQHTNGIKRYILMPEGLAVGDQVHASKTAELKVGNALPLRNIPVGFMIHNIEMTPNSGGSFVRSAGTAAQLMAKGEEYATVRMPSGEMRLIHLDCWATIGMLGNAEHRNITIGKAGRTRHLGKRPTVRGMAMNPIDHPHGGGEGRSKSGSHPMTPWGKGCKGTRTRHKKDFRIIKRRSK
jgi:large subunit ribosomal protein L2